MRGRLMVGLGTLDATIGVRIPAPQQKIYLLRPVFHSNDNQSLFDTSNF